MLTICFRRSFKLVFFIHRKRKWLFLYSYFWVENYYLNCFCSCCFISVCVTLECTSTCDFLNKRQRQQQQQETTIKVTYEMHTHPQSAKLVEHIIRMSIEMCDAMKSRQLKYRRHIFFRWLIWRIKLKTQCYFIMPLGTLDSVQLGSIYTQKTYTHRDHTAAA